ncbi:MAG: 3-hydroxyacyl-CoA dehydrogenase/enoyl-CoA hydratase family protein [Gammaproteobacteria bacterium]|nr:3-hydroxyacyl-CoA dehydrogenase/enoyl-CoA hydratase family protein [Gammaproteobacteria bacterium]MCP5459614.1 3-hydroxyacyl-CoA dehydrogenase/enoyl-CoA hydratase family protein [Gammaproteobacteria bacterium]
MSSGPYVRKVAILGAGVMGAQVAAHLASADVEPVLFDLADKGNNKNAIVDKAIKQMEKMRPAPAATKDRLKLITAANYEEHLDKLKDCDLIIEAIAERLEWKQDLYAKIAPYINDEAIFASNTSGLGITLLSEALPANIRPRFCGIHFFNPPRYMALVELIAGAGTDTKYLDKLETFLVTVLGKGVVHAKDSPNFIANRLGVFNIQATMYHADRMGLPFDIVDSLTGPALGRPSTATFRTTDLVGLDTMANVLSKSAEVLTKDPWQKYYHVPAWVQGLIAKGALGNKTKGGIYTRKGKERLVLDVATGEYRPVDGKLDPDVKKIMDNRNLAEKVAALRASDAVQAQFVWAILRDMWHYSAVTLNEIADTARDADFGMRWGYGWKQGPFEIWQAAGWKQVAAWIAEDIAAGKTMVDVPLPAWVNEIEAAHTAQGSWSPGANAYHGRSTLPVYKRQYFPEPVLGEAKPDRGTTVFETDDVRMWHQGDDIAILSFKSKMHAVGEGVIAGINQAIDICESGEYAGLVIWQDKPPFSAGADLAGIAPIVIEGDYEKIRGIVSAFQNATSRLRHSYIPVVAAVSGMALGGGCEIAMHCDRVVAALESYMGLVEIGVGLLPAGGGCKEFALRIAAECPDNNFNPYVIKYFQNVATAKVGTSAEEAKQLGILRPSDIIVFNTNEILYVAKAQAKAMAESAYRPPLRKLVKVAGRIGSATLNMGMVNMLEGHFMSEHDHLICQKIAAAICGGDVDPGTLVSEDWLLKLERDAFVELVAHPKSQERALHMLQTGKPLRN